MATFPGKPPNALGFKAELLLNGLWTDITAYCYLRDPVTIANMGRTDESGTIQTATLNLTLNNRDGRFTPKNSAGAYYPNITRNCQIRISVNATSQTGVAYSGYRFWGEVSAWPPLFDISQRDLYVQITASGIWRRIGQNQNTIGSATTRYIRLLTGTAAPAAYWSMEDGSGSTQFALTEGTGTNLIPTGTPSYAADSTSFPGSDAIAQLNTARIAANVSSTATPTSNIIQFALSVPQAGDSTASTFPAGGIITTILAAGTVGRIDVTLASNQLTITGYATAAGGATLFTGTISTKVNGIPVVVSVEITPSGGSIAWALRAIKPGASSVLGQVSGTYGSASIGQVTQIQLDPQGRLNDTGFGQLAVYYVLPTLTSVAGAAGGWAGENAVTRFTRLCTESSIPYYVIGSSSTTMGPQADDTMQNVLQTIESTDGGLLFETTTQFGLGYRTLASMQNQSAAVSVPYTSGALGAPLSPTYDDQLLHNEWTLTNYDNYVVTAVVTSGPVSIQPPPNGVGSGYTATRTVNAATDAQVNALAQQLLYQGSVDDVRYPVVLFNFQRTLAAPYFSSVPSLRIGDYLALTSMPSFLGGGTSKQLIWGWTEHLGGDTPGWDISFNTIPESPFESAFSPGTYSITQGPANTVAGAASVGSSTASTVAGSQIAVASVTGAALSNTITARSIGGTTQYIAAATPYDWSLTLTTTPTDATYFGTTQELAAPIAVGDTFTHSAGLGGPFTVTSIDTPSGGSCEVHFTPTATAVMSSGTVYGGKNGDQWINTSGGNQVNVWAAGTWTPLAWNATNVIQAGSITATQIAANTITASQIAAGIVLAGIVNGTTIQGATLIAYGTTGEILVYSGAPASGNLIGSWSGQAGSDSQGNAYPAGLMATSLNLPNQASSPPAVSGASTFYSDHNGKPHYLSQTGVDSVLERSTVNVYNFVLGSQTSWANLSAPLAYYANESNQSSAFEIEVRGNGVWGSGTVYGWVTTLSIDGTAVGGGASMTTDGTGFVAGNTFAYMISYLISFQSAGTGATVAISAAGLMQRTGRSMAYNSGITLAGNVTYSVDSTVNHTFQIVAAWTNTSSGESLTTYATRLTRYN